MMRYLILVACLWPGLATAQSVDAALRRAEDAYHGITTLRAEFTQTLINPMLGGPEESHGTLFLEPPNRFAMRFVSPDGDGIVADGTWLWLYAPSSVPDQVIRQAVPRAGMASPNLMGQFVDRPLDRYDAEYLGTDTVGGIEVDRVRLMPKDDGLGFRSAEIAIDRTQGLLRRMIVTEESGQRRTLVFHNIRTGITIPPAELRFEVPPGTRVVGR